MHLGEAKVDAALIIILNCPVRMSRSSVTRLAISQLRSAKNLLIVLRDNGRALQKLKAEQENINVSRYL